MYSALDAARNLTIKHNVSFNVYDEITGKLLQHHQGHNSATNSMLTGIGHYLIGDGVLNQGYEMLEHWVPQYISLGTMGLYSQEEDENGLPAGVGYSSDASESDNFTDYMNKWPGFGADGYDANENNGRKFFGIGKAFEDRPDNGLVNQTYIATGDTSTFTTDYTISHDGLILLRINGVDQTHCASYEPGTNSFTIEYTPVANSVVYVMYVSTDPELYKSVDCELISDSYLRTPISYRKIISEEKSEWKETIDIVFSAMISTGALKQFREADSNYPDGKKDYIFITEAGLWSRRDWPKIYTSGKPLNDYSSGDNGLLAGYRIVPPDEENWDMTDPRNRNLLKSEILRVGYNQVVQVVWKIQLGSLHGLTRTQYRNIVWRGISDEDDT